jgi:protease PrsW
MFKENTTHSIISIIYRGWFQALIIGIVLFIIIDLAIRYTRNFGFLPTLMVLGAFVVPVTFAAYFYRQEHLLDRKVHTGISLAMASIVFLISGIIGTIMAGVMEYPLDFDSTIVFFFSAASIEEVAKLVFPVILFILGKYRSEIDGLVFGIASGMGFAAFETLGFSLLTLMSFLSNINDMEQILITRGLFSPLNHAAWTGLICGAIWHYQGQKGKMILMPLAYFLIAVVLHFCWNQATSTGNDFIMYSSFVAIGGLGLFLVFRHLSHARKNVFRNSEKSLLSINNWL